MGAKPILVGALIVALLAPSVRAQDMRQDSAVWREYVEKLEPHAFVRVRLTNGKSVKGRIVHAGSDALRVNPKTRVAVPPRELPYDEIVAIDLQKEARWNPAVKVLLGVGIGLGTLMMFSLIALASGYD